MISHRWYFLLARLFVVVSFVSLPLACGQGPDEDCNECTLGERRCSAGGDGVMICKKISSTGCQSMVLERCLSGQECANVNGRSACQTAGSNCTTSCTLGEQRCEGENVAICRMEPSSGCSQFFVEKTCLPNQPCNPATGDCDGGSAGCTPQNPQATKKCVGNAVHWFDDCGKQGAVVETCAAGNTCQNAACVGGGGCQPKNLQASKKCSGKDIYWYDDCGQQRDWVKQCGANQQCQNAACVNTGCTPQNPQASKKCVGSSIYWFDDCGKQAAKVQDCNPPQTCQNAQCQSNCNNQCSAGQAQCVGNSLQTCDRDPNTGCYAWGQAFPCPSGQVCQGNICVADPNGNGGGNSRACKVGATGTCSSDNECCQGQRCRSVTFIKGCSPCSSSSDCPNAGFLPLQCCTIPIIGGTVCALACP